MLVRLNTDSSLETKREMCTDGRQKKRRKVSKKDFFSKGILS